MFSLHPQLAQDSVVIGDLPLSTLLLAKEGRYPWLILVPRCAGITEIYQLSSEQQQQLTREISLVAEAAARAFKADKMNVAALGNQVAQLHVHIIARYTDDAAWPGPVWGALPAEPYDEAGLKQRCQQVAALLDEVKLTLE